MSLIKFRGHHLNILEIFVYSTLISMTNLLCWVLVLSSSKCCVILCGLILKNTQRDLKGHLVHRTQNVRTRGSGRNLGETLPSSYRRKTSFLKWGNWSQEKLSWSLSSRGRTRARSCFFLLIQCSLIISYSSYKMVSKCLDLNSRMVLYFDKESVAGPHLLEYNFNM